jgi:hypothetical protein
MVMSVGVNTPPNVPWVRRVDADRPSMTLAGSDNDT